jgi:uncharacterized membrane protein
VNTELHGINNSGKIVGEYQDNSFNGHGFIDRHGHITTLDVPDSAFTDAQAINDSNQIVGVFADNSTLHEQGFLFSAGEFTPINGPNSSTTQAQGINDEGKVVGGYGVGMPTGVPGAGEHAFLYSKGRLTTIDVPGAVGTFANGINDFGKIVGSYDDSAGQPHGFVASKSFGRDFRETVPLSDLLPGWSGGSKNPLPINTPVKFASASDPNITTWAILPDHTDTSGLTFAT